MASSNPPVTPRVTVRARRAPSRFSTRRPYARALKPSGSADPCGRPVGEELVLPDRRLGLEGVDEVLAGGERLTAMPGRDGHDDRQPADVEVTDAVDGRHLDHVVVRGDPLADL